MSLCSRQLRDCFEPNLKGSFPTTLGAATLVLSQNTYSSPYYKFRYFSRFRLTSSISAFVFLFSFLPTFLLYVKMLHFLIALLQTQNNTDCLLQVLYRLEKSVFLFCIPELQKAGTYPDSEKKEAP